MRQHNALAPAAIEQQQLFIIHHILQFDSFCEKNIFSFSKMLCVSTTLLASAAIEQQITIHYLSSLRSDSFCERNISSFSKMLCVSTTTLIRNIFFLFKNVVRQHNNLASAAIEQQQLFIIHHTLRFDSFCERNISYFSKMLCVSTTT